MSKIKEKYPPNITTDLLMTKFFNITIVILGNTFFFEHLIKCSMTRWPLTVCQTH